MRTRSLLIAAMCGITILGWALGRGSGPAVAAHRCPGDVGASDRIAGVGAIHQGRLVGTASGVATSQARGAVARQVATSGAGTAYVEDRAGDDAIVLSTRGGTRVLPQQ